MLSEHYVSRACDHIAHLAVIQYRNTWNPGWTHHLSNLKFFRESYQQKYLCHRKRNLEAFNHFLTAPITQYTLWILNGRLT